MRRSPWLWWLAVGILTGAAGVATVHAIVSGVTVGLLVWPALAVVGVLAASVWRNIALHAERVRDFYVDRHLHGPR